MDEELLKLVSEFCLDYRREIYLRLFGDYWLLLRGNNRDAQLWSKEHHEWQTEDALQEKFLFDSPESAWECYKSDIRGK